MLPAPLPDGLERPAESLPLGLTLDDPESAPGLRPVVGESEEVERARALAGLIVTVGPTERDQTRLVGMDRQPETGKPLRQDVHHPTGVVLTLEADHEVVGETNHETAPSHAGLRLRLEPLVQHRVQEDVR